MLALAGERKLVEPDAGWIYLVVLRLIAILVFSPGRAAVVSQCDAQVSLIGFRPEGAQECSHG
jgi:hypothetical protein